MFGGSRRNNPGDDPSSPSSLTAALMKPENPPSSRNNVTGFDPEGLERFDQITRNNETT
jgi:hypothetical protein